MKKTLNKNHFCYVIFKEMTPVDFLTLMELNVGMLDLHFLNYSENDDLYSEAKGLILRRASQSQGIVFDFAYDSEPYVFNKFIDGQLDRQYKICIFEFREPEEEKYKGKTSEAYYNDMPMFFDPEGNLIKNSLN